MRLRIISREGEEVMVELTDQPLSIGRSAEADVTLADEKVSRFHAQLRLVEGHIQLKDLQSKNGTTVNERRVDSVRVRPGDRIRIGPFTLILEDDDAKGTSTVLHEVEDEMAQGKGYHTILQEIVRDVNS